MSDKQPMQADGNGKAGRAGTGEVASRPGGTGESGGGAYPNPHSGKGDHPSEGPLGHGGQTEIGYHGTGQLGDTEVEGQENRNSATKGG